MGRQINFFMDEETELRFFEEKLKGCQIWIEREGVLQPFDTLPAPHSFSGWWATDLYKPEFGDLEFDKTPDGRMSINSYSQPVIEYLRSGVWYDDKRVTRGRLWVEMKFWQERDGEWELVSKSKELERWFNSLVRWVRKNVPRVKYHVPAGRYHDGAYPNYEGEDYMSDSIRKLLEEHYYRIG